MQSLDEWFGRQVDMKALKENANTIDPVTGLPYNWNHSYHNNPYWNLYNNTNSRNRDRLIGNVNMSWKLTDWVSFEGTAGTDWYVEDIIESVAQGDVGIGYPLGHFNSYSNRRQEINANARFAFAKNFGAFHLMVALVLNITIIIVSITESIADQLIVPGLYSVSNQQFRLYLT